MLIYHPQLFVVSLKLCIFSIFLRIYSSIVLFDFTFFLLRVSLCLFVTFILLHFFPFVWFDARTHLCFLSHSFSNRFRPSVFFFFGNLLALFIYVLFLDLILPTLYCVHLSRKDVRDSSGSFHEEFLLQNLEHPV